MKKQLLAVVAVIGLITGVAGFLHQRQTRPVPQPAANGQLQVVTTNSILEDMVKQVGGRHVAVYSIVKRGTDPHEYEPRPADIAATAEAKVIFHNGLNLETGGNGWFNDLITTTHKRKNLEVFAVSRTVTPKRLTTNADEVDPHAWLDLANGIKYVQEITRVLKRRDPQHAVAYQTNAEAYTRKLRQLHTQSQAKFKTLPANQRVLVTSEGAFKYFAAAYQVTPAYIWEINTEAQGTPAQMRAVIKTIRASQVQRLFVEASVAPKSMQKVAQETGLKIQAKLLTDSLAPAGQPGSTYYEMMQWNLTKIYQGLSQS